MPALVRPAAVAGRFYPNRPNVLRDEVNSYLSPAIETVAAFGCLAPHAGYMYSGHIAGAVYARLQVPQRCIVLCPNHTGMGQPLSIMSAGEWETPLGRVPLDTELAIALKTRFPLLSENADAHRVEHAVEVQLPFLLARQPRLSLVPIAMGTGQFEALEGLGNAIAEVAKEQGPVLIVASSDMNHYENDSITRRKDHNAIDQILALNPRGLFDVVAREDISMCGFGPAVAMLTAAKRLGASCVELVKYATSGDISGDRDHVVGYAGLIVR
jgi:AmmeMemoRadiSam system protein B